MAERVNEESTTNLSLQCIPFRDNTEDSEVERATLRCGADLVGIDESFHTVSDWHHGYDDDAEDENDNLSQSNNDVMDKLDLLSELSESQHEHNWDDDDEDEDFVKSMTHSKDPVDCEVQSLVSQSMSAPLRWKSPCKDRAPRTLKRISPEILTPIIRSSRVPIHLQTVFLSSNRGAVPDTAPPGVIFCRRWDTTERNRRSTKIEQRLRLPDDSCAGMPLSSCKDRPPSLRTGHTTKFSLDDSCHSKNRDRWHVKKPISREHRWKSGATESLPRVPARFAR